MNPKLHLVLLSVCSGLLPLPTLAAGAPDNAQANPNAAAASDPSANTAESADQNTEEGRSGGLRGLFTKSTPAIRYPVTVETDNNALRTLILEHLPLITQQQEEALDREQAQFLAEDAPAQVTTMLETEGYFNSKVSVEPQGEGWVVRITPGPRTVIDTVDVAILGDILNDEDLAQYYKSAMDNWVLPVGDPFTQSAWGSSKSAVLSAVVRKKYPLAAISTSRATIDPNSNRAQLSLNIDSRQPVYFGDIEISGTERYPESVVRGMARFSPGSPYDLDKLLDYQQALEQDGHYGGASVQADFGAMKDDRVPVKVAVSEVPRQKFELGLRYDSADGPGIRLGYDHYNVFKRGYVFSSLIDTDRYQSTVAVGLSQPRQANGRFWTSNLSYSRSTTQNLETNALSGGVWYVRDRNNIDSRLGIEYVTESNRITNGPDLGNSNALMLTASWRRENVETLLRPANGYYLDGKIGTTLGSLGSSSSMQRIKLSAGYYYTPEQRKYGTWLLRGQLGYVHADARQQVPSSLMFRSGGANTVRGYEQDSIGLDGPNNSVLPNRAMLLGSVEYQVPVSTDFSVALFHDAGSVSGSFKDLQWRHGSGVGLRWFSPLAPFAFDLAYGHHDKKIRWHISLGTRF